MSRAWVRALLASTLFLVATACRGERPVGPQVFDLTFPDGTRGQLSVPAGIDVTSGGIQAGTSGSVAGFGRDLLIIHGDRADVASRLAPDLIEALPDGRGGTVEFRHGAEGTDYLVFEFSPWTVLVYDYPEPPARMTEVARRTWASNLTAGIDSTSYPVFRAEEPLQLAARGEHGGPWIMFAGVDVLITLTPTVCLPDGAGDVAGDQAASFCDPSGLHVSIQAVNGGSDLVERLRAGMTATVES